MLLIQRNISGMLRTTADSPATNNIQTLNNWDVITVGSSNAQRSVRINAATPGIDSTPITAVDSTEFRIGGATLASTHAHVAIAAIVAYSRSLTADEEAQVRNYLKTQYGTP
jgi:alkyl hydroperoxide reductase subunit AhpF